MSPIQQMLLGVGAVAKKTYVDDVFSTYLYAGNSASQSINNGIDLAGEGGMVWAKRRSGSQNHILADTVRGITKYLNPNDTAAEVTDQERFLSVSSTGFAVGDEVDTNGSSSTYASWTFRKAPGFFTCLTYTGSSSARTISHDLGCVPGAIFIKKTSGSDYWAVYHEGLDSSSPEDYYLKLNTTDSRIDDANFWNDTKPTASVFSLGDAGAVNSDGHTYIAYLFAGGESTNALARSVDFDGSNDGLGVANSSDFSFGSGDFTVEGWFKLNQMSSQNGIVNVWRYQDNRRSWVVQTDPASEGGALEFFVNSGGGSGTNHRTAGGTLTVGQWFHFAGVRDGNTIKLFVNGDLVDSTSYSSTLYDNTNDPLVIGSIANGTEFANASISNIRITKGQAIYTSSFKVPTEPLTTTSQGAVASNVKLLCCNNSSVTGSTKTPTTISAFDSPTASTDSPFDDPAGFVFGDAGDQGIIKCGSYVGNGSATGPEINLGWEPQFLIVKQTNSSGNNWRMWDSMRGIVTGGNDESLYPSTSAAADSVSDRLELTPTGFKITRNDSAFNGNGDTYIFLAIRRPDGYVGKPPSLGTGVFAMDTGNSSSTIPTFDSGFPVDFGLYKDVDSTGSWAAGLRLIGTNYLQTDTTADESAFYKFVYDSNVGWYVDATSDYQSWMWKRHAGFDVVAAKGGQNKRIAHSLNKIPEMYWVKNRDSAENWTVYHKGLNSGTNPENRYIVLNATGGESGSDTSAWNSFVPTSTHISFGTMDTTGGNSSHDYLVMLFASVDGISKVGYYTGDGVTNRIVSVGFNPRFLMVKRADSTGDWYVLDTTRGFDKNLFINTSAAQTGGQQAANTSASGGGFVMGSGSSLNVDTQEFIYYAHA